MNNTSEAVAKQSNNKTLEEEVYRLIDNHLSSFLENNLEALMGDYTEESVMITQAGTYKGIQQIKAFFTGLLKEFPQNQYSFQLEKQVVCGNMLYIVWNAKTPTLEIPLGSDTFIISNGKISQQTFVGQLIAV
jgi:hypothetical protein